MSWIPWRPKNWKEINPQPVTANRGSDAWCHYLDFEAGADAILEALPRLEVENIYNTLVVDVLASAMIEHNVKAGYLVFIPSEGDKDA